MEQRGSQPVPTSRARHLLKSSLIYFVIIATTLALLDIVSIATGLLPPRANPGDPLLGWRPAAATGKMAPGQCTEYSSGTVVHYTRNEDGIRTSLSRAAILADTGMVRIAVTGDSHTDLCAPNEETHAGFLEAYLRSAGVPSVVLNYGSGRWSPLQEYLAYTTVLRRYSPRVLVVNLYTGNDFYDMLRSDDRPHFVAIGAHYGIAPPSWFAYDDPASPPRSRVLYALRVIGDKTGVRSLYYRLSELRRLGKQSGGGLGTVAEYMWSLWNARAPDVGYEDAFSAQFLNQQLFFHYFPDAEAESLNRVSALLRIAREQNPNTLLVLSPIPSYELVGESPVDSSLVRTLARLPVDRLDGMTQEGRLYETLRGISDTSGWVFVDNLKALRAVRGAQRLFNDFDYHITPPASRAIGKAEAEVVRRALASGAR